MKNTLTLLLLLFSISAQSQSTRLVLLEEFTQASCGPCAEQNPAMNALLNRHPDKAVSIKYHTYFPGYDPMNDDNPDQVDTRYDYYGLFGVPHIKLDGGVALSGQPNELDSLDLVNRHAVPSPFTIDVAFALSPDGDSIFCNAQIVCTQAVSGNLVAHVVVIERDVYFEESPGSNDEVHFEGLMKQMLPSDLGTPLASNWTPGDQLDLSYAWKLENVYDNKQLACVVFIQNESTREVLQAGYRQPDLANDAGLWHTNGVPGLQCTSALSPVINVRNHGYDALTALDIEYWLNGVLQQTFPWTGNIPAGLNQDIALPTLAPPDGGNVIAFTARNPNGEPDPIADNDTAFAPVVIYTTTYPLPLMETFASAVFPPSNIGPYNPDNDGSKWVHANVGNGDAGSAKLTTYDSEYGRHDYLYLPMFDFTTASAGVELSFDVAYASYNTTLAEKLEVKVSTDCGATWSTIYTKEGTALSTAPPVMTLFTPSASQWRTDVVSLDAFVEQSNVLIQFDVTNRNGNHLYLDNLNVTGSFESAQGVKGTRGMLIYPQPAGAFINIAVTGLNESADVIVRNSFGAIIGSYPAALHQDPLRLNVANWANGVYAVEIRTTQKTIKRTFVVVK